MLILYCSFISSVCEHRVEWFDYVWLSLVIHWLVLEQPTSFVRNAYHYTHSAIFCCFLFTFNFTPFIKLYQAVSVCNAASIPLGQIAKNVIAKWWKSTWSSHRYMCGKEQIRVKEFNSQMDSSRIKIICFLDGQKKAKSENYANWMYAINSG